MPLIDQELGVFGSKDSSDKFEIATGYLIIILLLLVILANSYDHMVDFDVLPHLVILDQSDG